MKKSVVQQLVTELPDPVDVDALIEKLHLLDKIEQAEQQISRGEGIPHDAVKGRLSQWLK